MRALDSLRVPGFRRFMLSMAFFTAAMQIQVVAQGWLIFDITGSSLALGIVISMWSVAIVVVAPFGGVVADRVDKRLLIMLTWAASGVIFGFIWLLIVADQIEVWHLALAALLNGILFSFNIPARFALISQLVSDSRLMNALALVSLVFNIAGVVFPLVGGALVDSVGVGSVYLCITVLYLVTAGTASLIPSLQKAAGGARQGFMQEFVAGIRLVRHDAALLSLMFMALAAIVFGQSYFVLLPELAADRFGVPASGLGLLMAMLGLGGVVGNLVIANLRPNVELGRWMVVLGCASALGIPLLAVAPNLGTGAAVLLFLGVTGMPFLTINQTMIQRLTPPEARGRVLSLYMLTWGMMPIGIVGTSALADAAGVTVPLVGSGVALLASILLVVRFCPMLLHVPQPMATPPLVVESGSANS